MTRISEAYPRAAAGLILGAAAALSATSCGGAAPPALETLTVEEEVVDGVLHVRIRGVPSVIEAEPVAAIGGIGGGDSRADEFGRINAVVADDEGYVYVADGHAREIRIFDQAGRHVRSIGRRGEGPGEFGSLYSIAWAGDTLAALDPGNARIGLFHRDGGWAGQYRHLPLTGDVRWVRLHPYDDGFATPTIHSDPERSRDGVYARFTRDGPLDTVPRPAPPENLPRSSLMCPHSSGGGISFFTTPFGAAFIHGFAPSGDPVVVPRSDRYRIAFLGPAGDTVRTVERAVRPIPIADAEWDEAIAATGFDEFRRRDPGARCEPAGFVRPAAKPAIRHLFFDDALRMWVETFVEDGFAFDVFDSDGRLIGTLPVADRLERVAPYVRGDRLHLVRTGELDVESVTVYRVRVPDPR